MRYTLREIEEAIEQVKLNMESFRPTDPEFIKLDCELNALYQELQLMEDNMARLQEEELYYQEEFVD